MSRWTQDRTVAKLRYNAASDPKGKGWHYIWEGAGFGVQVFATGRRKWIQSGSIRNELTGKHSAFFRALGSLDEITLADARCEAALVKVEAHDGTAPHPRSGSDQTRSLGAKRLARTTLDRALQYYVENRNCAPSSKATVASLLRHHLSDWMSYTLLAIDSSLLQGRYHSVVRSVSDCGKLLEADYANLPPDRRLLHASPGYFTGIKSGHDVMEGFGPVWRYWVRMHRNKLQVAGILVSSCPTEALIDDLEPQPQRVKSVPAAALKTLLESFPTYRGNELHPLLMKFLLASGLRVGIAMGCRREFIQADRIVIPAKVDRSKVRWKKRHLEHMSYVIPVTPDLQTILNDIYLVGPRYGDSETWLFPSMTSASGHAEEEKNAALWLRKHSGVRFTPHQLRHNFASAGEDCGYSTVEIGELLNQSRGSVTQRYIDERLKRHRLMMIAIAEEIKRSIDGERFDQTGHIVGEVNRPGKPGGLRV